MVADPKPTIALQILSAIVIAGCVFLFSVGLSALTVTWDPCSGLICAFFYMPFSAVTGIQQYRGTFWRNPKAAFFAAICLFFLGGLLLLIVFTTIVETLLGDELHISLMLDFLWPLLAIGALSGVVGWANLRWSRRLTVAGASNFQRRGQFTLWDLLAGVTIIAVMTASVTFLVGQTKSQYAENVPREEAPIGLPMNTRDVSFCQGMRGTIAYEFTIDEAGFKDWINTEIAPRNPKATLNSITNTFRITRYNSLSSELNGPDSITITNGLSFQWTEGDRGIHAAFDRTTNRAYYFAHFH
jgi:hypothetical protein